jgi:hypothetical protein
VLLFGTEKVEMMNSPAPVLAYAVSSPMKLDDHSVYNPSGSFTDDTIDMSGNFFSQVFLSFSFPLSLRLSFYFRILFYDIVA